MINTNIREYISSIIPNAIILDNPSFDNSIIGITDEQIVYSFDKMILEMAQDDNISSMEAQEFVEYNTIRAIPYMGENKPIIIYPLEE